MKKLIALLAMFAPLAMAQTHKAPPPPKTPRLYIFDCGTINATDASGYRLTKEEVATTKMSMECFLIAHPKGNLMWDVGAIPDSSFPPGGGPGTLRNGVATKTLTSQLAEAGYSPADINFLALSHYHWDHTANANDFASATWIVEKKDHDAMFTDPPPTRATKPEYYSALRNSKTILLDGKDYDVFGDGTVVLKFAPGHTEGHQVLFLKLKKTGPIVLSGDLYHYPQERTLGLVPKGDLNRDETAASRASLEEFMKKTGAKLWIQHDYTAFTALKKSPEFYQ